VVLLSGLEDLKMVAELVPVDITQISQEYKLDFDLHTPITDNHQIELMFADQKKGHAYFFTQSYHNPSNYASGEEFLIDYVHFLKLSVDA
jgi:hypothetical protein